MTPVSEDAKKTPEKREVPFWWLPMMRTMRDICTTTCVTSAEKREFTVFPRVTEADIRFGQPDPPSRILRTETLNAWSSGEARLVVTSPEALAERVASPELMDANRLSLKTNQTIDITELCNRLGDLGFCKTDYVYEPGQYARRGSIVDVFSYGSEDPVRIDFFDDEIDSIRLFNVETQLSESKLNNITISAEASATDNGGEYVSLLQYTGSDVPVVCRSEELISRRIKEICNSCISSSAAYVADTETETDLKATNELVDADRFLEQWKKHRITELSALPVVEESKSAEFDTVLHRDTVPQTSFHKNFDLMEQTLEQFLQRGYKIYILSESEKQIERLRSIFADRGSKIPFTAVRGVVHSGFTDNTAKICILTDHQIFDRFHRYTMRSDRARTGKMALSLKELNNLETGDFVVHTDHGVGRFGGLVRSNVGGSRQEMVKLIYDNDDLLFVSIHSLHKLAKFRGKDGVPPRINRLGSGAWNRLKERTKSKLKDIARDLIKLYAQRREQKGFAYSPDSYLQHELEASFIYEDTPDQLRASQAVKRRHGNVAPHGSSDLR